MTSRKLSFLFLLLFVANLVSAAPNSDNDPLMVKSKITDNNLSLVMANLEGVKTTLQLISFSQEEVLHEEIIVDHNGYNHRFDLAELEAGRYYLKIVKGDHVLRQVIVVNEFGILLSELK